MKVGVAIDNDVRVWVNGHDVSGGLKHTCCPAHDSFVFTVGDAYINRGGENVLAVQAFDRGILAYLDIQVTADVPPPYNFSGFLQPIDPDGGQRGQGGVGCAGQVLAERRPGAEHLRAGLAGLRRRWPATRATLSMTLEETVTAGGSSLTYDPLADQYTYVWKTDKAWAGTCRQLSVTLNDDTVHTADFQFK